MELTATQTNQTKGIAILMMVFLHLFNRDYKNLFNPLIFIGEKPMSYYISLFCDACLPIYLFCSGYGLYISYLNNDVNKYSKMNMIRIKKLLINYWVALLLFAVILGSILGLSDDYPGSVKKFMMNFSTVNSSYNGSWWFLFTYILLATLSVPLFKIADRYPIGGFAVFFILYCLGYSLKTRFAFMAFNEFFNVVITQIINFLFTLFQFMLGVYAYKYSVFSKLKMYTLRVQYRNFFLAFSVLMLIIIHGVIPSLFIAVAFILIFNLFDLKSKSAAKVLDYFAFHSTNIWLVHLFFVSIFFSGFVYGFKYVLVIYAVVLISSIFSSYVINLFTIKLQSLIK